MRRESLDLNNADQDPQEDFLEAAQQRASGALLELRRRNDVTQLVLSLDIETLRGFLRRSYPADSDTSLMAEVAQYLLRDPLSPEDTIERRKEILRKAVGQQ